MSARIGIIPLLFAVALLITPLSGALAVAAAGGEIAGTVTDPKGAVVAGAAVIVSDPVGNQTVTSTTTDGQGRYRIEGLAGGSYVVTISATGFADVRREVTVAEGKRLSLDVKLEVSQVEATVTVSAGGLKPNADPVYAQLRQTADLTESASVNNLVLKRDAATFTLKSGELYFLKPVEGRSTGAVFIGEGEIQLTPPTEEERRHLSIFTEQPALTEQFTQLVIRFTDTTFEEVKASPNAKMGGGSQADRARDLFRSNQTLLRKELRTNADLRTLADIYSTAQRPGYFTAFISGKRFNKLIFDLDPLGLPYASPDQVALVSRGATDAGIWASFPMAQEFRNRTAASSQDRRLVDITRHEMDVTLKGSRLAITDRVTLRARASGARVLPFDLYPGLRVSRVQDEQGTDLHFIQEAKNEDGDFGVVLPSVTQATKNYKLTIQYEGDGAVRDFGGGNFALLTRSNWYPSGSGTQFGDRAVFDITFRYPKGNVLVATGELAGPETEEGGLRVARWTSGTTELAVAGFNYGKFKKKEVADTEAGYNVEFFANSAAAPQVKARQDTEKMIEAMTGQSVEQLTGGQMLSTSAGSTVGSADAALAETQNSVRVFNAYFGKLPYKRIAMTQQPFGNFGQSWPTLVYMPYTAYLSSTERLQLFGSAQAAGDTFWEYVGPHEVAHQWFEIGRAHV
jgi:hypothetical protein